MSFLYRADSRQPPHPDLIGRFRCAVTSPGYFGMRSYGDDYGVDPDPDEVGREASLDAYVESIVSIAGNVWSALTSEGVFWLNLGDTNSGSGGAGGDHAVHGSRGDISRYRQGSTGIAAMQRCLVPQRVALALQGTGWLVRHWITWDKGIPKREASQHVRRPFFSSEVIMMLTKGREYYWDHEAHTALPIEERGDVWHMSPYRGRRKHSAPFPDELPMRCISLTTKPGDWVYDPCSGSGTTIRVADSMGRVGVGVDLYAGLEWKGADREGRSDGDGDRPPG